MKSLILVGLLTLTFALSTQARDWSFSKDTVYEWKPGQDTVFLTNQGTDSLKIDTGTMELIRPSSFVYSFTSFTFQPPKNSSRSLIIGTTTSTKITPVVNPIGAGKKDTLFHFDLDLFQVVAKGAAGGLAKTSETAKKGDTLIARLIFAASNARGRDTLIVFGTQQASDGILSGSKYSGKGTEGFTLFDAIGRSQRPGYVNGFEGAALLPFKLK